ncbi:MAG: hypothetical protein LBQ31_08195, partial [Bacteroidales bacterium]|nr:hypothetical protein [Bacteroidales bacterium]
MNRVEIVDLGQMDYRSAWALQTKEMEALRNERRQGTDTLPHRLFFVQHPHVYTLGKSGHLSNMLAKDAEVVQVDRGGDITYHGHGQWVVYPVFRLDTLTPTSLSFPRNNPAHSVISAKPVTTSALPATAATPSATATSASPATVATPSATAASASLATAAPPPAPATAYAVAASASLATAAPSPAPPASASPATAATPSATAASASLATVAPSPAPATAHATAAPPPAPATAYATAASASLATAAPPPGPPPAGGPAPRAPPPGPPPGHTPAPT